VKSAYAGCLVGTAIAQSFMYAIGIFNIGLCVGMVVGFTALFVAFEVSERFTRPLR
jgi:hypothetical protein